MFSSLDNLSLHIGLPKTGTTSLQSALSGVKGYAGRGGPNGIPGLGKEIRRIMLTNSPDVWLNDVTAEIRSGLVRAVEKSAFLSPRNGKSAIYSFENLLFTDFFVDERSWYQGSAAYTSVDHIRNIIWQCFPKLKELKILITVRKQPDWLASLYAQYSNRIYCASQAHFEKQVKRTIRRFAAVPPLDLELLVAEAESKLQPSTLVVLPVEAISSEAFWENINVWMPLKSFNPSDYPKVTLNKRYSVANHWALRPYRDPPRTKLNRLCRKLKCRTRNPNLQRRLGIELSSDLRTTIELVYLDSNKELNRYFPDLITKY